MLPPLAAVDFACASCGIAYERLDVERATELIGAVPDRAASALASISETALRVRPSPPVWSAIEYACHLRDVYVTYTIRLHRTRLEWRPALEPMFNDLRAVRFRYAEADPDAVLVELARAVAGCLDEIERTSDWDRTASRLPEEVRDARWLVRQASHEGVHHVADIVRLGEGSG